MMEQVYAIGITCIQLVQEWFQPYDSYFEIINKVSNPHFVMENLVPILALVDSVFASQLLLCLAFVGWLNTVMKWWILEDRPYWWVQETSFYSDRERPWLMQTPQTCETGPGCPSGHSACMALTLAVMGTMIAHVATDRKWKIPSLVRTAGVWLSAVLLVSVFLARMYVAAHFPHQVLIGGIVGLFLAPALCIYVSDPYIWCYGRHAGGVGTEAARRWHIASALGAGAVAVVTYWGLIACDQDPQHTIKLAFRWCEYPDQLRLSSTPIYSLVQCTAYLLGWAYAVTPDVAKYRHNTKDRSIFISFLLTASYMLLDLKALPASDTWGYYTVRFVMFAVKPTMYLSYFPIISMHLGGTATKVVT